MFSTAYAYGCSKLPFWFTQSDVEVSFGKTSTNFFYIFFPQSQKKVKLDVYIFLSLCRKNVERRALLENMEGLFLAVDEIVDGG